METPQIRNRATGSALLDPKIVLPAISSAFVKLAPRALIKNPVMFVLEVVSMLTTIILVRDIVTGGEHILFEVQIVLWLWFTVLFANFAEAIAEGRGKAQADTLRRSMQSPIRLPNPAERRWRWQRTAVCWASFT
jgi:K+-transporting ATPase ATPase B chain